MGAPIVMIQWLKEGEYRETRSVVKEFAEKNHPNLDLHDVSSVAEFRQALLSLSADDDCQFLFIGSHGIKDTDGNCIGIGKSEDDCISWIDLWHALAKAKTPPVLWLGACSSSMCAVAWSPFPTSKEVVKWLEGFQADIYPIEIENILRGLITLTGLDPVTYADEEISKLQSLVPGTCVQMHYPVHLNNADCFLETSKFPSVLNKTFKEHLEGK
ncbi:MAG: hypothetical protein NTX50_05915 [Candidatus Sumerlaeota bacterium]|nr:hypothetical protein [Candidatus Sumerlaeota bacterium]